MIKKKRDQLISDKSISEIPLSKINSINREESVDVTWGSYGWYVFFKKINWIIFPITVLFFIASELINTFYMRFLAQYDNQKA